MLFLAVFLGFVAENIREKISENIKAKELAESLYQEAYSDSVDIYKKNLLRLKKEETLIYFRDYVRDSSLINLSEKFYPSFVWSFIFTTQILFEPKDGILNQLRNSGALRYFKSNELQKKIGALGVAITNVRSRNEQEYQFVQFFARPFVMKFFDFR